MTEITPGSADCGRVQRDPYEDLDAHVISVKALYCEDGCGLVETSGYGEDRDAAKELAPRGWVVRPHSMGGLTALCKDCAERLDTRDTPPADPTPTVTCEDVGCVNGMTVQGRKYDGEGSAEEQWAPCGHRTDTCPLPPDGTAE